MSAQTADDAHGTRVAGRTLQVTQLRSSNGANPRQRDTLRSLGLHRIGHTVRVADTPAARGMVHAVRHMVSVEEPE